MFDIDKRSRAAAVQHPVYVSTQGACVKLDGLTLCVATQGHRQAVRLDELSDLVLMGNVHVTTPALHELMRRGIPVCWMSAGGWYLGHTAGIGHGDAALRGAQHQVAGSSERSLEFARPWVTAKIKNARTLLRRNGRGREAKIGARRLIDLADRASTASDLSSLRGFEGAAAAAYFNAFSTMIRRRGRWAGEQFDGRRRRPPTDPLNAALSFIYAVQIRSWTIALATAGLDVFAGFLHRFRHGRPALALDLVEPSRPRVADSVVLRALNGGRLKPEYMTRNGEEVLLGDHGRRVVLDTLEDRLEETVRHEPLGREIAYRDLPAIESGRLAHALRRQEAPPLPMSWR